MSRSPGPLLVLVSGAPGSGKTTLAVAIAGALGLFHLHRDGIWDGLRFTAARRRAGSQVHGVDVWYAAMKLLLESGVSLVADGTLYRDWDEANARPLLALADVVNVHCRSDQAVDRHRARLRRAGTSPDEVAATVARVEAQLHRTSHRLDLGCRCLQLDTSDGYDPPLEELLRALDFA